MGPQCHTCRQEHLLSSRGGSQESFPPSGLTSGPFQHLMVSAPNAHHTLALVEAGERAVWGQAERQEHCSVMDTNHPCPSPASLHQALLLPSRKGNPSAHQLPACGCSAGHSNYSNCGGRLLFNLPALCLAPGASVGFIGCLRIKDSVVNHFPHPRPFLLCPWDQRSSTLDPHVGTVPAGETAQSCT